VRDRAIAFTSHSCKAGVPVCVESADATKVGNR
jgi:hypothetical protein